MWRFIVEIYIVFMLILFCSPPVAPVILLTGRYSLCFSCLKCVSGMNAITCDGCSRMNAYFLATVFSQRIVSYWNRDAVILEVVQMS